MEISGEKILEKEGARNHPVRSQWMKLFFVFLWFFCSAYSFEEILFEGWYVAGFFVLLATSMLLAQEVFHKNRAWASKVTVPMAVGGAFATAVMSFLPGPLYVTLFLLSGLLMGPLLLLRLYGLLQVAPEKMRFRLYISAVALCVVFHSVWAVIPVEASWKFLVLAVFVLFALGKEPALPKEEHPPSFTFSSFIPKGMGLSYGLFFLLIVLIDVFSAAIHSYYLFAGYEANEMVLWAATTLLPAAGFVLYAWCADYKWERPALVLGVLFFLGALWTSFFFDPSHLRIPLILADGLGGSFAEYQILTFSLYLIPASGRPLLTAALGFILDVILSAVLWTADLWFPPFLLENGPTPQFIALLSLLCLFFIGVVFWQMGLFSAGRGFQETLEAAIIGLTEGGAQERSSQKAERPEVDLKEKYALTKREQEVLERILKGLSAVEIAKELFVSERTVRYHMTNIYAKTQTKSRVELLTKIFQSDFSVPEGQGEGIEQP